MMTMKCLLWQYNDFHDGRHQINQGWTRSMPYLYYLHLQVPPLELKGLPADIGPTVDLSQQLVVGWIVVNERAVEGQALH